MRTLTKWLTFLWGNSNYYDTTLYHLERPDKIQTTPLICTQVQHSEVQSLQPDQVLTKRSTLPARVQDTRPSNYGRDCYGLQESIPRYENKESDHCLAIWSNWINMIPSTIYIDWDTISNSLWIPYDFMADTMYNMAWKFIVFYYDSKIEWFPPQVIVYWENFKDAENKMIEVLKNAWIID